MPSFNGFLSDSTDRLRMIGLGSGFSDKLKLFGIAFFQSIPNVIRDKLNFADAQLSRITEDFTEGLTVKVKGKKCLVPDITSLNVIQPQYEEFEQDWFHPRKGDIVVDIGAHIGKYTLEAATAVGQEGKVIAVEPLLTNFNILKKNIRVNKLSNVEVFNLAAWHSNRRLTFYIGNSSATGGAMKDFGLGTLEVEGRKMDTLLNRLDIKRVDWIKIDVEGAEYDVLLGLEETLRRSKPRLLIEVLLKNLDSVKTLLSRLGYIIQSSEIYGESSGRYVNVLCTYKGLEAVSFGGPTELSFELEEAYAPLSKGA